MSVMGALSFAVSAPMNLPPVSTLRTRSLTAVSDDEAFTSQGGAGLEAAPEPLAALAAPVVPALRFKYEVRRVGSREIGLMAMVAGRIDG